MDVNEYQRVRAADKSVVVQIAFERLRGFDKLIVFRDIEVHTDACGELTLDGSYNCDVGSVTFNFSVKGVGAICRYCVNGKVHPPCGRHHMHELNKCVVRDDLRDLTAKQVWQKVCAEWSIYHSAEFYEPEVVCQ